jgi:hypothetical protein
MELSLSRYDVNGCAVVPGVLTANEVEELRAEALRICRGDRGAVDGLAPPLPGDTDDNVIRRNLCIHFPHKVSAVMAGTLSHPSIVDGLVRTAAGEGRRKATSAVRAAQRGHRVGGAEVDPHGCPEHRET